MISELHQAEEVLAELPNLSTTASDPELEGVIEDMITRVDPGVPETTKRELSE